jgi:predicted nuclease of predicted toxin-antitoxin system
VRIKLYLDEDVDISLAHALKQKGIDVLITQESGNKRLSNSEQLEFAVNSKRAIFTHNKRDFLLLHKNYIHKGKEHYGIILSDQRTVGEMLRGLSKLIFSLTAEQMKNRQEFLSNWL